MGEEEEDDTPFLAFQPARDKKVVESKTICQTLYSPGSFFFCNQSPHCLLLLLLR